MSPMRPQRRRLAFTLMEIMIVLAVVGLMAAVLLPRLSSWSDPPLTVLQRSVEEAGELAMSGAPVRFVLAPAQEGGARGEIRVEAFVRKERDSADLSAFLGTARPEDDIWEWTPVALRHPPYGGAWGMEPETIQFFTDGSCTPARISWGEGRGAETFLLTVTGWCVEAASGMR